MINPFIPWFIFHCLIENFRIINQWFVFLFNPNTAVTDGETIALGNVVFPSKIVCGWQIVDDWLRCSVSKKRLSISQRPLELLFQAVGAVGVVVASAFFWCGARSTWRALNRRVVAIIHGSLPLLTIFRRPRTHTAFGKMFVNAVFVGNKPARRKGEFNEMAKHQFSGNWNDARATARLGNSGLNDWQQK